MSLNFPFLVASEFIIAYAWNEALRAVSMPVSDIMKKLRIPLIIISLVMLAAGDKLAVFADFTRAECKY